MNCPAAASSARTGGEYGLAAGTLAVGFSGYFVSLLGDFGVAVPAAFATPTVQSMTAPLGMAFVAGMRST